jgi:hemerythrin
MPSWSQNLAIQVPAIDAQHKELFCRFDAFVDAVKQSKGAEEIGRTLAFLSQYVNVHFGAEERLMQSRNYAGFIAHKTLHEEFRREMEAIQEAFQKKGAPISLLMRANNLFNGWLTKHIGTIDVKLAATLGEDRATLRM